MKRQSTIALHDVKEAMRRGTNGGVENRGGFGVFIDADGRRQYVVDDESMKPVAFKELKSLLSVRGNISLRVSAQLA